MVDQAVDEKSINELFDTTAYELFEKIGEGGFGRVYRAKQLSTNQSVAIKFMSVSQDFDQATVNRYIDRFERETLLCSRLQHPNIVRLLDKGQNNGLFYAVYEYVEGKTLKQQLEQEGSINPLVAAQIMAQVLDALAHAHEQGVIHRDIKPANIMLMKTGAKTHAKILDFGIGTLALEARQLDHKSITLTQETLGTPSYSAPEQLRGEPPTPKTDIYVWGLVFIECLTGQPAMGGSSLAAIFHKQLSQANVPLPAALVGHPVTNLLRRVLQKKAQERAGNAAEIYHEFIQLNFATLVGDLTGNAKPTVKLAPEKPVGAFVDDATVITNHHMSQTGLTERKQISVLCVSLWMKATEGSEINNEVADALHRDQLAECIDIAVRFGATHVATLASSMLFYFGYPIVSDNDGRLCARTALEIIHTIKKRNSLLKQTQGIESVVKIGMNTGLMTVYADAIPEGETANIASELAQLADNNQILITIDSKSLLETHLEFQPQMHRQIGLSHQQTACYSLIAERQVEAFGFLRGNKSKHQLIGREVELSQLMGLLADEQHTESQCAHVFGEAGIGKSRLIFELRTQAQGFNQYVAQCLPEHKNNALYPILKVLRYKYSLDGLSPPEATDLLRRQLDLHHNLNTQDCLPILCSWLALPLPEQTSLVTHSPQMQKRLLFDTLVALLLAQVSVFKQPNLFLFEDMHWADPTSLEFIAKLITTDNFTYSSDVFISTSRQALPEKFSDYAFVMVALHKLTQQQTQDFVQLLFDGKAISSQLFDTLVSRTDGIPLFIEEVVGMLKQKGLVRHQNGETRFVSDDAIDQVPSSLRDSLQQKLDSLAYAKETAQLAATIGREFDYDLLVASSEQREEQIQIDLEELIETELIYLQRKVKGDSYLFKHALVRDAAYESMLEPLRHQSHYRIAQSLESEGSEIVETTPFVVAQHYAGAEHFSKASQLGIRSVQKMVSSSANAEALIVTDKVTQWNKHIADSAENLQATLLLNEAVLPAQLSLTGYGSVQVYDVGMTIKNSRAQMQQLDAVNAKHFDHEVSRSDELDFKVDWIMYLAAHYKPDRKLARKLGEELLARCRANQNRQQAMTVLVHLAQNWMTLGDMPQAKHCFDEAYSMFDEKLDYHLADEYGTDAKSQNLSLSAEVDLMMGQIETAYSKLDEALVHGRKIGHQASVIFAHIVVAQVAAFLQDYDKVIETTEAFEAYNGGKESYFNHYLYLYYYCAKDDITAARGALDQLVEQGQLFAISYYATHVVDVYLRLGDVEEATQLMEQTLQRGIDNDDIGAFPFLKQTMAQCYYQMDGDLTPRVIELFEQAIADAKQQHAHYFELENTVYLWTLYDQHQHPNLKNLDDHYLKELRAKVSIPANSYLSQAFEKLNA